MHAQKLKNGLSDDLQELLLEDGEEFVEAAFMALLKRRPDVTGGLAYLRALRNGTNKLQILYELSQSDDCRRAGGELAGLADACARAGIVATNENPLNVPPAHATQVTRAEQLLVLDDSNKFIEVAYWVLLKRAPDEEGLANYQGRLQEGTSKTQILYELFVSPERGEIATELPGLRDAFAREGLLVADEKRLSTPAHLPQASKTLAELLAHQGGQFIDCAYLTLLKRAPDSPGYQHRWSQLLAGTSKIQILSEMSASQEAIIAGANLHGLAAAVSRYNLSQLPVLGALVKLFVNVEGNSPAERRARATEQRLLKLEAELGARLEHLETSSSGIVATEQKALSARQDMDARIASLEKSVVALRQLIERYAHQAPVSGPQSADAAKLKSSGRIALELRTEEIARDLKRLG